MSPLLLSYYTATSCIGVGLGETLSSLKEGRGGLSPCDFDIVNLDTYIGQVESVDQQTLRLDLQEYDCRNNRLAQLGLQQDGFEQAVREATDRYGQERVGVFLGTSTSGILQAEHAYRLRDKLTGALPADFSYKTTQNNFSVADFVRRYFDITGPAMVVSTACSSSAKVFGSAWRMINSGVIDAAVVGGVDSLCLTTLYGFNSLELVSSRPCRPFDADRDGLSIGEAAAFILVERSDTESIDTGAIGLLGFGESSDAYHMSSPHPEGRGASSAMKSALVSAGIEATAIDYINLHGTATPSNDAAEGAAVASLFGNDTPCSSTKGATGHTLGAAGGLEAVISALSIRHDLIPGGLNVSRPDPSLPLAYLTSNQQQNLTHVLSNSFGFGGTNCSLIFGRIG